ncbi:hypothetical protein O6H91_10G041800 [Diphasiastrum complanatum]|uniref:Uncharacterized protein n=1 Tax=Diphasiastrum complanatum TaxID=34168 RepID=A0ACC2CH65_DIPCM|nr:hypothetical protein O6H91_10G041800 [Diphasiastrum complanatum]
MCILLPCPDPTTPGVWWRDDASWVLYDTTSAQRILSAAAAGSRRVELGRIVSAVHTNGATYFVDLTNMRQVNASSWQGRDIKIVEENAAPNTPPPNTPPRMLTVHYKDDTGELRKYDLHVGDAILRSLVTGSVGN